MIFISNERKDAAVQLLNKLKEHEVLTFKEYKNLLEVAYHILSSEEDDLYNLGLSIICHVAESKPADAFIHQLLFDCIVESRIFLYHQMYANIDGKYSERTSHSSLDMFSVAHYTLTTGTVLTRDQKSLFDDFQKLRRLVVSAPTSFGKSRIVSEIIIHNEYSNIAIILPTIALLNETYLSFRKNPHISNRYNLVNTLTQSFEEKGNIFILTPEKMDLLLDQNSTLKIDFFTMDEIYKIQDDDDRKQVFTHCLYRLSKMKADFYLIGPYFQKFSSNFLQRTNSTFRRYSAEIVQKDTIDISGLGRNSEFIISNHKFKKLMDNDRNLINISNKLDGQSLVYLGRKDTVETRARKLAEKQNFPEISSELIDYIKTNIDENWSLVNCLKKRVAFHHSAIPKYIQTEIVDSFNSGDIDILVCTSTLIEGVNTSAKNIMIYDNEKGGIPLSGFDVKNIKGRAGRFLSHFIGRVITMARLDAEKEKDTIEFSYFDNTNLSPEETIQIEKRDLSGENLKIREHTEDVLNGWNIPYEIVRKNKFIPIHSQYFLIEELRNRPSLMQELLFSLVYPTNEQIEKILDLCYRHLFNEKDRNDRSFPIWEISRLTKYYIHHSPSIKDLIRNINDVKSIDAKIRKVFSLISRYFEFALPKYFAAFEVLFNFVYEEKYGVKEAISFKALIMKLEFGYVEKHQIALKEAGVPVGIINKISTGFQDCDNLKQIKAKLELNPTLTSQLTRYERKILNKYV